MTKVTFDISVSLDGFVAGANPRLEAPLGDGGNQLHEWAFAVAAWRERHGRSGGETNADDEVSREAIDAVGAHVMGRQMFGGGEGPWGDEPWEGWWGDEPPFRAPVFVLTHHASPRSSRRAGPPAARMSPWPAAPASSSSTSTRASSTSFRSTVAPVFLGGGVPLFEGIDPGIDFEPERVVDSPGVTHLRYRVLK